MENIIWRPWQEKDLVYGPRLITIFLTASYLYYHRPNEKPICNDEFFDRCCQMLKRCYNDIEHPHKHLVIKQDLDAGSGFTIKEVEYPTIVKNVALSMSRGRGLF